MRNIHRCRRCNTILRVGYEHMKYCHKCLVTLRDEAESIKSHERLRDEFAMAALALFSGDNKPWKETAERAYNVAGHMMNARKGGGK